MCVNVYVGLSSPEDLKNRFKKMLPNHTMLLRTSPGSFFCFPPWVLRALPYRPPKFNVHFHKI